MKNKIISVLCLTVIAAGLFTGCGRQEQVNKKAIIHAVGIDMEEDKYKLTLQVFQTTGAGAQTPVDPSQSNTEIIEGSGDTVSNALIDCQNSVGKDIFLGHTQVIVFGESVTDINPSLEYFSLNKVSYLGMTVAAAQSKASEIIKTDINRETYSAEAIDNIFKTAMRSGECINIDFLKVVSKAEDTMGTTVLPVVKKTSSDKKDSSQQSSGGEGEQSSQQEGGGDSGSSESQPENSLRIDGAVVYKEGKPKFKISKQMVVGYSYLMGTVSESDVVVEPFGNKMSVTVSTKNSSIKLTSDGDSPEITISAEVDIDVDGFKSQSDKQTIADSVIDKIRKYTDELIDKAFYKEKADIFDIARVLRKQNQNLYNEYLNDPESVLQKIKINVRYTSEI